MNRFILAMALALSPAVAVAAAQAASTGETEWSTRVVPEIEMVRRSAVSFMERMIRQDDRAALVIFSGAAYVAAPFTNDLETLREGSRSLAAWGSTALWDSTGVSLYYLLGLQGRSALVLLSDGLDRSSRIDFGPTLEFAERSGIAVYT